MLTLVVGSIDICKKRRVSHAAQEIKKSPGKLTKVTRCHGPAGQRNVNVRLSKKQGLVKQTCM